jgi:imidazoleglycerol-phosphate dehydratase
MKAGNKSKRTSAVRSARRTGKLERVTTETQIRARLALDGKGRYKVRTGIRFFDHMLELFAKHGGFDLEIHATGDLDVDQHHTVEDVGIVLGDCFKQALGDKRGINRAGYFIMPLDETLAVAAVDLAGRPYLVCDAKFSQPVVGDLQTELVEDFFYGFATHLGANLHLKLLYSRSTHHAAEALFKTFARAMKMAVSRDARMQREMPSTKGLL